MDQVPHAQDELPNEAPEIACSLKENAQVTMLWQLPRSSGRLYTALQLPGQPAGLLWAEKSDAAPWSDAERQYLALTADLMARSPQVLAHAGLPSAQADMGHRLQDAAVVSGRMAHDFDNVLTGIIGFADLSLPLVPQNSQAQKFLQQIKEIGTRGTHFTQLLRQLGRSGQKQPYTCKLQDVLSEELTRLQHHAKRGVQFSAIAGDELPELAIDRTPLQHVLQHLLDNAAEALKGAGRVTLQSRVVDLTADQAKNYRGDVKPGFHVEVTIEDDGPGFAEAIINKVLVEPFVTNKVRHRGLGLAIVYRTLTTYNGGLRLESSATPGRGASVQFVIPVAAVPHHAKQRSSAHAPMTTGVSL
jgi:signal transduction histidine kinase